MPAIDWLLPLVDKDTWRWRTQSEVNTQIGAGGSLKVYNSSKEFGWFYWGLITIDGNKGPDVTVNISSDRLSVDQTIAEFYDNGITDRGPGAPSLNRYDTNENIFGVLYEPRPPLSFTDGLTVNLEGSPDDSVRVTSDMLELEVIDMRGFKKSLREVLFSSVNQSIADVDDRLATVSAQIAQTNSLLTSLVQGDNVVERVEDEPVDEEEVAERVGSLLGQGTEDEDDTEDQKVDRDEDLTTLGK